jgi:hypothetical protein
VAETTKLITTNHAVRATLASATPKLAVGAPVPPEDALYPLTNAFVDDRNVKWRCEGPGSDVEVVIDLGGNRTVGALGLLAMQREVGSLFPNSWYAVSYVTYPDPVVTSCVGDGTNVVTRAGFNFAGAGVKVGQAVTGSIIPAARTVTAVAVGSVTLSGTANAGTATLTFSDQVSHNSPTGIGTSSDVLDSVYLLPAPVTMRYVKFIFAFAAGNFVLGKFLAGPVTDLGIAYSPGSVEAVVKNGVSNKTVAGMRTFTQTGQDSARVSMLFSRIPGGTKDAIVAQASKRSFVMVHPTLGGMEFATAKDEVEATHLWASPDLWDVTLDLEQLV